MNTPETGLVNEAFKMTRNRKLINILFAILVAMLLGIVYLYRSKSPESIGLRPATLFIGVWLIVVILRALNQAAAPGLSSTSKTTHVLVVVYHFLVAAIVAGALALDWVAGTQSQDDRSILQVMSWVATPIVLLYFATAWGILRWKNWSRSVSLALNWINILAAVLSLTRIRLEGVASVLLSCLVLWWLSLPGVKLQFRRGNVA